MSSKKSTQKKPAWVRTRERALRFAAEAATKRAAAATRVAVRQEVEGESPHNRSRQRVPRHAATVLLPSDDVPAGFVRPFWYDGIHYIWDGRGDMAADFGGAATADGTAPRTLRPRGWGRMTRMDDPEGLMDAWAAWLRATAAESDDPVEIIERLNRMPEP